MFDTEKRSWHPQVARHQPRLDLEYFLWPLLIDTVGGYLQAYSVSEEEEIAQALSQQQCVFVTAIYLVMTSFGDCGCPDLVGLCFL